MIRMITFPSDRANSHGWLLLLLLAFSTQAQLPKYHLDVETEIRRRKSLPKQIKEVYISIKIWILYLTFIIRIQCLTRFILYNYTLSNCQPLIGKTHKSYLHDYYDNSSYKIVHIIYLNLLLLSNWIPILGCNPDFPVNVHTNLTTFWITAIYPEAC